MHQVLVLLVFVWPILDLIVQPVPAFHQTVKSTILSGTITFESKFGDRPAADYFISFQKTDCESCVYSSRTNIQGRFRVEVPPGRYLIVAQERASTGEIKDLIPPGQLQVIEVNGFQVNCDIRLTMPAALEETLKCVKEQEASIEPSSGLISLTPTGYCKRSGMVVLELKNQSNRTFFYLGNNPESPVYQYQVHHFGWWKKSTIFWCDVGGLGASELNPYSTQKIFLRSNEFEQGRNVKLKICITGWFSKKGYDIWTQPFKVKKLPEFRHDSRVE